MHGSGLWCGFAELILGLGGACLFIGMVFAGLVLFCAGFQLTWHESRLESGLELDLGLAAGRCSGLGIGFGSWRAGLWAVLHSYLEWAVGGLGSELCWAVSRSVLL